MEPEKGKHAARNFRKREKRRTAKAEQREQETCPMCQTPGLLGVWSSTPAMFTKHARHRGSGPTKVGSKLYRKSGPAHQSEFALGGEARKEHEKDVKKFLSDPSHGVPPSN